MSSADLMLRDNEELILDLHPHWWYMAKAIATSVAALVIGIFVITRNFKGNWQLLNLVAAAVILLALGWFAIRYLRWVNTHLVLTSDRLIWREGVIAKKGIEIPLQRINTIFFNQRMVERVLRLGDLKIESASEDGAQIFEDIANPDKVQHEIYAQMEANENRGLDKLGDRMVQAQHAAGPAAPTIADQIADLHRLVEQGALTDAEFQAKKAELLDRM